MARNDGLHASRRQEYLAMACTTRRCMAEPWEGSRSCLLLPPKFFRVTSSQHCREDYEWVQGMGIPLVSVWLGTWAFVWNPAQALLFKLLQTGSWYSTNEPTQDHSRECVGGTFSSDIIRARV